MEFVVAEASGPVAVFVADMAGELLTQLEEEQVRFGVQVGNELATALNDASITGATRGVSDLQHAVEQLEKQLAEVAGRQTGPPLAEVAAVSH